MDAQVDQVGTCIKSAIQRACESLAAGVDEEVRAFKEKASSLASHENYEKLQKQNKSTLESCELLRQENIILQGQLKELLAKHASKNINSTSVPLEEAENSEQPLDSQQISRSTQRLIDETPELRAILDRQATEYRKLQTAHSLLLSKLKEHQEVIIQLQRERIDLERQEESEESHLAHLRNVIEPPHHDLGLLYKSPRRKIKQAASVAAAKLSTFQSPKSPESKSVTDKSDHFTGDNSGRDGGAAMEESRRVSAPTVLINISSKPAENSSSVQHGTSTNDNSQPVFVSERPVKRRRTAHADRLQTKTIKTESSLATADDLEEYHSIDLDAITAPIVISETRSKDSLSLPRATSVRARVAKPVATGRFSAPASSLTPALSNSLLQTGEGQPSEYPNITDNTSILPEVGAVPSRSNSAEAGLHGKPHRPVLQAKTSNMKLGQSIREAKRQSMLSLDKEPPEVTRVYEPENVVPITPQNRSTRTSFGADKESNQSILGRNNGTNQHSTGKYATSLQKKRNQLKSRLRNKDIHELSVNDFVLNPAMNQGFKQTFGDLDSSISHRHRLANCSKPECCGAAFAAAIQNSGITSLQGLSSERDSLLRSYLGFPPSNLGVLSEQEYQRLLGEAMGKQFAEKCSRQKHYRAESPPGYWRADFPTTQEREVDKQHAEESERKVIEQRRKEALQDGGLWMFRDEV